MNTPDMRYQSLHKKMVETANCIHRMLRGETDDALLTYEYDMRDAVTHISLHAPSVQELEKMINTLTNQLSALKALD